MKNALLMVTGNILLKGIFIAAACYLLTNGHPWAGSFCILGAFIFTVNYSEY